VPRTPTILIVGPDPRLRAEVEDALRGVADTAAVLHHVPELRQGCEAARSRRPDLALVQMGEDLRALRQFADELARHAPETALAALFAPEAFGPDVSERAVVVEAFRAGVQDVLTRPLSRADLEQLLERLHRRASKPVASAPGKVLSVLSNKGGVGKSTVSVNTACALARRHPEQVLLVDASLQMGVCSTLLHLKPELTLTDAARQSDRLDETLLRQLAARHPCGLHLLAAPRDAVEAAELDDEIISRVLMLARRTYPFVVVDTFPMLDRVMMAVLDLSDRTYLVLEAVVPTVVGAAQMIRLLDRIHIPRERQRVVLNRFRGPRYNLRPADVARRLGRDIDHILPFQDKVTIAANLGRPYALDATRLWGFGRALGRLVQEIEAITPQARAAGAPAIDGDPDRPEEAPRRE
jgi:pilus assembly protein CpaE